MKNLLKKATALLMVAALTVLGVNLVSKPNAAAKKTKVKVGFIYVGSKNDGGWSSAHDLGRIAVEKQLKVDTICKESVSEGPDVTKVMEDMIDQGVNVIFGTSFGYGDYMEKMAKKYPNVKFFHCSGNKSGKNFVNYFGKIEEPRYLSGVVAALKTKSNKIGYVGAFSTPEVIRGINAFTLGVRSVNPKAIVSVRWTNTWYDPSKEKEAAKALLDEGCDVITQHQDSPAAQQAAEEKGKWSIGYDSDMSKQAPKAYMTAPVWNWAPYYVSQVKAIMNGTWKPENYWGGTKEGVVDLAPLTSVAPAAAVKKVAELQDKLKKGTFSESTIFTGPLKDQKGKIKVKKGKTMSKDEIMSMNWFVQGVKGQIAK